MLGWAPEPSGGGDTDDRYGWGDSSAGQAPRWSRAASCPQAARFPSALPRPGCPPTVPFPSPPSLTGLRGTHSPDPSSGWSASSPPPPPRPGTSDERGGTPSSASPVVSKLYRLWSFSLNGVSLGTGLGVPVGTPRLETPEDPELSMGGCLPHSLSLGCPVPCSPPHLVSSRMFCPIPYASEVPRRAPLSVWGHQLRERPHSPQR